MNARRLALRLLVSLGVLVQAWSPGDARGQAAGAKSRLPARVEVRGLFGDGSIVPSRFNPYLITVENRTRRPLRGEVLIHLSQWNTRPAVVHRVALDLPPRATRRVDVDLYTYELGLPVDVRYQSGDRVLGKAQANPGYRTPRGAIVAVDDGSVLASTARNVSVPKDGAEIEIPIGEIKEDPDTGDLLLPTRASSWAPADLVIARITSLERASDEQLRAIHDYVTSGGVVLLFPRTEHDLRSPVVKLLVGDVEVVDESAGDPVQPANPYVPETIAPLLFRGGPDTRAQPFGLSRPLGLGQVHIAGYDAARSDLVDDPAATRLIADIYAERENRERIGWGGWLPPFREPTRAGAEPSYDGYTLLQRALDPNENYQPGLVVAALLLLIYLLLVGPFNFTVALRRNRPALVLVTTPVLAVACLFGIFVVGYIGKGIHLRYRALELVELAEGQPYATSRRYAGLFVTRPLSFELEGVLDGYRYPLLGLSVTMPTGVEVMGNGHKITGLRARLWETVFVREDRRVDLDGVVRFVDAQSSSSGVRSFGSLINDTRHTLRGAVLFESGKFFKVGTVEPGARANIESRSITVFPSHAFGPYTGIHAHDPAVTRFLTLMEIDRAHRDLAFAFLRLTLLAKDATLEQPYLLAWIDHDTPRLANMFEHDRTIRFLRVIPRPTEAGLAPPLQSGEPVAIDVNAPLIPASPPEEPFESTDDAAEVP